MAGVGGDMMFVTVFAGVLDLASGNAGLRQRRARCALRAASRRARRWRSTAKADRRSVRWTIFRIRSNAIN